MTGHNIVFDCIIAGLTTHLSDWDLLAFVRTNQEIRRLPEVELVEWVPPALDDEDGNQ